MTKSSKGKLDHLNPEQRQAVEHGVGPARAGVNGSGTISAPPVAVIAGAGSGKTKSL